MRIFLLFFCMLVGFMPVSSYGCECIAPSRPTEELEKFDAVFTAKVLRFEPKQPYGKDIVLNVGKRWKGKVGDRLTVDMHKDGCAYYGFEEGKEYLIYARLKGDKPAEASYNISQCSRTKPREKGQIEMRYLDAAVAKQESREIDASLSVILADKKMDVNQRIEAANLLHERLYRAKEGATTIDEEQAIAAFLKAVKSPDDDLRLRVAQLLNVARFVARIEIKQALLELLKDGNQQIVTAAVYSLSSARDEKGEVFTAMEGLLRRLLKEKKADEKLHQRSLAAIGVSLAKIATTDAQKKQVVTLLAQAIDKVNEPYDKTSLIQHLGFQKHFAHSSAPQLLTILKASTHYHVKQYTLAALADVGAKEMLGDIKPYIHDENCYVMKQSMEAVFALDKAGFAEFFAQDMMPILQNHFDRCKFHIIWGLQTLGAATKAIKPFLEKKYATLQEGSWEKGQLKNILKGME